MAANRQQGGQNGQRNTKGNRFGKGSWGGKGAGSKGGKGRWGTYGVFDDNDQMSDDEVPAEICLLTTSVEKDDSKSRSYYPLGRKTTEVHNAFAILAENDDSDAEEEWAAGDSGGEADGGETSSGETADTETSVDSLFEEPLLALKHLAELMAEAKSLPQEDAEDSAKVKSIEKTVQEVLVTVPEVHHLSGDEKVIDALSYDLPSFLEVVEDEADDISLWTPKYAIPKECRMESEGDGSTWAVNVAALKVWSDALRDQNSLNFDVVDPLRRYRRVLQVLADPDLLVKPSEELLADMAFVAADCASAPVASMLKNITHEAPRTLKSNSELNNPVYELVGLLGAEPVDQDVNLVKGDAMWEEFAAVLDSGAAESVAPIGVAESVPLRPSRGSKSGQKFHTADGTKLPNHGEKTILAVTEGGRKVSMKYQVADVTKPLCSVGKVMDNDNLVCFGKEGGVIYNLGTKQMTPFIREHGVYVLKTWNSRKPNEVDSAEDFTRQG